MDESVATARQEVEHPQGVPESVATARQEAEHPPEVPESVAAARQEVANARLATEAELDQMGTAVRAAVDIPTKVKRDPLRYGALGAGAAFLLVGGPKKALRAVEKRVFPRRHERRLTPKEIERTIDRLPEEEREAVRAHLERDFAAYLQREHPDHAPNARHSLWRTYDLLVGIVGGAAAREMIKRFIDVPADRSGPVKDSPPANGERYGP